MPLLLPLPLSLPLHPRGDEIRRAEDLGWHKAARLASSGAGHGGPMMMGVAGMGHASASASGVAGFLRIRPSGIRLGGVGVCGGGAVTVVSSRGRGRHLMLACRRGCGAAAAYLCRRHCH